MTDPFISFAICTHNEGKSIEDLFLSIFDVMDKVYEIVVLDDYSDDPETLRILEKYKDSIKLYKAAHTKDFAFQKNLLNNYCVGKWIINLDADEILSLFLMQNIVGILQANSDCELFHLPRLNFVDDLDEEYIRKWGWQYTLFGGRRAYQWPDYQGRIYKNEPHIRWKNKVHEVIGGAKTFIRFPAEIQYAIIHTKTAKKQVSQNEMYSEIK